jgi:AcrR family transcriptional regulator
MSRAENKKRTRDALCATGLRLFAEQGFDAVTVEQIALEAGSSLRTFFRYFRCKEALLFGGDRIDVIVGLLADPLPGESLLDGLRRVVQHEAGRSDVDTGRRQLRRQLLESHPGIRRYLRQLLEEWEPVIERTVRERLDADPRDLRPLVFAQLCSATAWAVTIRGVDDETGFLERWLVDAGSLLTDGAGA